MRSIEEHRLWSQWRGSRDEKAFERLVEPHLPFAIDLARRLGCDEHDADDMAQQALVALAAAGDDRPAEVGLRAWIGRRVSLGVKSLRRARRRRNAHEDRAARRSAATATVDPDARDAVDAALAQLDPDERQLVVMRFLHDMEYREVSYVVGISPLAVRLRVHRALRKLRVRLGTNASALVATGVLWTGSKPAHALIQGVWLMSKSVKTAVVAALVVLVALFAFRWPGSSDERQQRAPTPHGREVGPSAEIGEVTTPVEGDGPVRPSLDVAQSLESVRSDPWSSYEQRRATAEMMRTTRVLKERIQTLAPDATTPPPRPDPTARLYLETLIAQYQRMAAGPGRAEVLAAATTAHRRYLEATHDLGFLPFFEGVLADGSRREQVQTTASLTGLTFDAVVDLLLDATRHSAFQVRAAAIDALADVRDGNAARAHRAVVSALRDAAAEVRWSSAVGLEFSCGTGADVPALLDGIRREDDPVAMHAMIQAVRALDPDQGDQRVRDVLAATSDGVRAAGENALAHETDPDPFRRTQSAPGEASPAGAATSTPEADASCTFLERLGEELLKLAEGEAREQEVRTFASTHADYVRKTQRTDLLPLIRRIVEHSNESERRALLGSLGRVPLDPFVDQLIEWTTHAESSVRSAAGHGLVGVGGGNQDRSFRAARALLDDPDTQVRLQVVSAFRMANRPEVVTALIERLSSETEYPVVYAIVRTATSMDKEARDRIEKAAETIPADRAALVRRALEAQPR